MKSKNVLRWLTCLALAGTMSNVALAEAYSDYTLEERVSMLEEEMKESKQEKVKPYDGQWDIFGYGRTALRGSRNNNWNTSSSEPHTDNFLGRMGNESESNYLEIGGSRTWLMENGSWAKVSTRVEYGNNYHFIDSSSPESDDDSTQFELKELFIELGNLEFMPEDYTLWAGRRYYKRQAGFLTDDYFTQSSGIGFGIENPRWSTAFIGVDADGNTDKPNFDDNGTNKNTVYALDMRYHAIDKWDFQTNLYIDNEDDKPKDEDSNFGFALRATYDLEGYYFFGNGFSNASLIYGQGLVGGAAGTNFGDWVPTDIDDDAKMVRLNTMGVLDIDDKWSVGTELNILWGNDENPWAPDGYKGGFVVRPQYRVNNNFKYVFEGSYGRRDFDVDWGGFEEYDVAAVTFAPTFTIDSGFWGRPEIRTFVTYVKDVSGTASVDGYTSEVFAGVQGEFWF
ncbi:maltoporin [Propionigenium maris DSM 9537]|uniref:Maltoporin n=1 Tax=Propionigenium maris DSM 9537 TaxID=1123000 RepID=A0A9W6GL00_9FUSO|nr:carbohydrate porin [Propionigenium maris]GLI56095.1 maltoporin [Propionigenium maris DSM 9537]